MHFDELRYNGVSPSGKATDSDSVIRAFESLYPSQEGIIRTMKEIHGSYYFLRKNISALSFAEFRDFKEFLRETDIAAVSKTVIYLVFSPNFFACFRAWGCSTEKNESQREKLTLKIRIKISESNSMKIRVWLYFFICF